MRRRDFLLWRAIAAAAMLAVIVAVAVPATAGTVGSRPGSSRMTVTEVWTTSGHVPGTTILWDSLAYNSRSWQQHVRLVIGTVTGDGAATTVTAPITCTPVSSGCGPTGQGLWAGEGEFLPVKTGEVYNGELGWESPGTATNKMAMLVDMTFDNPLTTNLVSLTIGPAEQIRCDSMAVFRPTKGGCVYLHATQNFLVVSTTDPSVTNAAKFMAAAQKKIHNHAGWYGHGGALTRLTDARTISRNRSAACKNVHPGKGQSCDEYPFASTNQGASLVPANDFDSMALNAAQNSKVGSYLASFLLHQRIASGDSYYVSVIG